MKPSQKFVLIVDELGQERISCRFISQVLKDKGEANYIKILKTDSSLRQSKSLQAFVTECSGKYNLGKKWNVILPTFSNFIAFQKPKDIFHFIHQLIKCEYVKRIYLWASGKHVWYKNRQFYFACLEYMADLVVYLHTNAELSVVAKKSTGGVINNFYTYNASETEFSVLLKAKPSGKNKPTKESSEERTDSSSSSTFKIELDEEEMVARNAMKLPYEKTNETTEGSIIYTPDAADDFDDEDPDEDLNI